MEDTRSTVLGNAMTWVELTYSSVKLDALAVFGVITLIILLLCTGAYQEAVRQAHLAFNAPTPQDPAMMPIVNLVNQYGTGLLVAICYFSNATKSGLRREMFIDIVTIALGVLLPQLVFHATYVWTTQEVVTANNFGVNGSVIQTLNMEWMLVWGISMALAGLAFTAWRFARRFADD